MTNTLATLRSERAANARQHHRRAARNDAQRHEPGGEVVATLVAQVHNFEAARVLVAADDLTNTANVGTTSDHGDVADL